MSRKFTHDQWLRREYGVQCDSLDAAFVEATRRAFEAGRMEGIREGERDARAEAQDIANEARWNERRGSDYDGTY